MYDQKTRVIAFPALLLFLLAFVVPVINAAGFQDVVPDMFKSEYAGRAGMINLSGMASAEEPSSPGSRIDNSIDEDKYMIGMGDVFHLSVIETPSISYIAKVNQNGDVRINEFGILQLGKISLREAKKRIAEFVRKKLGGRDSVYVTLRQGKIASVTVNGAIAKPGIQNVDGVLRVLDCIVRANNGTVPNTQEADLRNVLLENSDTTRFLDLFRYNVRNDLTQNPYIYPGDRIFVKQPLAQVLVIGELVKPVSGSFVPLREKETLRELFEVLVTNPSADLGMVVVQRGATVSERYDTVVSIADGGGDFPLEHGDVINVVKRSEFPELTTVGIVGAVKRPGPYSVINQVTTARELLERCGGYLDKANPERAYILRNAKKLTGSLPENALELKTEPNPPINFGSIRQEMNLAFSRMNSFQDYSVISLAEQGAATPLENGDQLVVPFRDPFVYVSGSVARPGAYPFTSGDDSRDYIKKAGGFTRKSDRRNVYVVAPYHTSLQLKSDEAIEEGDIIVIPDSQNNKIMITFIMPVLQVASTLATIILAMVSVLQVSR